MSYPAYLELYEQGILQERAATARERLASCTLCPLACRSDRLHGEAGECRVGREAIVASYGAHFGEENVLRGWRGSGTVFFSGCNLRCVYCQNYDISQFVSGHAVDAAQLAEIFLDVQREGCHNLNLVTPSHVVAQILEALAIAVPRGLRLPIVYNTSGYDSVAALRLLDGVVDIYMPDVKYSDSAIGQQYSGIPHYWEVVRPALREMHRQVGDLRIERGLAVRGLLIRHLVLPGRLAGSQEVLRFIAEEISRDSWINLMDQYHPSYRAYDYPELARRITPDEYAEAVAYARSLGLHRGIPLDARR
ncbi:MAG: radical SAM protein [Roseiflexus sp.]|nr:radical SAM protein [Roseiflexus sp.]MDW8232550.1 radical SAM protein [Roseiflexaceae bacterium]